MKSTILGLMAVFALGTISSQAAVTYNFGNQAATFDGNVSTIVALVDGATNFNMSVAAVGGNLNSNATSFGVDDSAIDGTSESITISFSTDILFNAIDFSSIGADITDGASFTIGGSTTNLFTGATDFSGGFDIYTPSSAIALTAGDTILLTGSSATSSYDLDIINVTAVPEPSTALLGALGALAFLRRRR